MTTLAEKKKYEKFSITTATESELKEYSAFLRQEIMQEFELDSRFVKFMELRFPCELSGSYVSEWAQRVKSGVHFGCADKISKKALRTAGYTE